MENVYSKYIERGGNLEQLLLYARADNAENADNGGGIGAPGTIFRVRVPVKDLKGLGSIGAGFIRIRALKLSDTNYRFADTVKELEHMRMLHGLTEADAERRWNKRLSKWI